MPPSSPLPSTHCLLNLWPLVPSTDQIGYWAENVSEQPVLNSRFPLSLEIPNVLHILVLHIYQ